MLPAMASPAALSVMDASFCHLVSTVGPEVTSPSSLLVKDASKRKRVNRNAKLKQCKLDARREQWLSQVSSMKPAKDGNQESPTAGKLELGEIVHQGESVQTNNGESFALELQRYSSDNSDRVRLRSQLLVPEAEHHGLQDTKVVFSPSGSGSCISDGFESEHAPESPASASPHCKVKRVGKAREQAMAIGDFEGTNFKDGSAGNGSTGNIKLSFSPCAAETHKVEETGQESESDDWEAAADALGLNHSQDSAFCSKQSGILLDVKADRVLLPRNSGFSSKPSSSATPCELMARSISVRAWRPDDEHRPASLPSLGKQQSLPARFMGHKDRWMYTPKVLQDPLSGPPLCPICAEELDSTDSSFEPCVCGFQLCLFCHHRIVSDDGRCPGCRRFYQSALAASPAPAASLC